MASRPATPVRFSHRRGSIGAAILLAVSLSLLGAQAASGTRGHESGSTPEAIASRS